MELRTNLMSNLQFHSTLVTFTANPKRNLELNFNIEVTLCITTRRYAPGMGNVKFRIFTLTYNAQFWLHDNVANMFLVRFELRKHLRTLSEHFEQNPRFFVDLKLLHGVKQASSRKSYIFRRGGQII